MPASEKIKEPYSIPVLNIVFDTLEKKKQAFVFVNSKRSAEKTAEDIAKKIKDKNPKLDELAEKILVVLSKPTKQCERLAFCVRKGTAFHHAGLASEQREIVEDAFRESLIKVISCTPTLAAGVDLPAYRTIIRDAKRYGGKWGMTYIPVLEYNQMAGRAGRPKYDTEGQSILIASTEAQKDELLDRYVYGEVEPIYSKLAVEPVLRTYTLSLIASGVVNDLESLENFFSKTFWAFQFEDMEKIRSMIQNVVINLKKWKFLFDPENADEDDNSDDSFDDDFMSASELVGPRKNEKLKATLLGTKVSELYLDPYTANYMIKSLKKAETKIMNPFAFLQMISNTFEIAPQLRVKAKELDMVNERLLKADLFTLEPSIYDSEYDEFLNSIKTAMFMEDWIDESYEENLMEKYDIRPGEIKYKLDLCEWLLMSVSELCRVQKKMEIINEITKLRKRLKYGVKEELLALLQLKNIGRVRARKMFKNGIKTIGDVKSVDASTLSQLIGRKITIDVKAQVGEKVTGLEVKKNKRKGQINLNDFT